MSNNCTFKFNEDGLVKVSEEDFQDYQAVAPKSFAAAYRVWIDDNFADDIRRLALRDLLRHDLHDNEISARRCFKLTQDAGWTRVEPELTSVLRYRPKLANELCRELEYCLEQNLFPYQQTLDFLIECILKTARKKRSASGRSTVLHTTSHRTGLQNPYCFAIQVMAYRNGFFRIGFGHVCRNAQEKKVGLTKSHVSLFTKTPRLTLSSYQKTRKPFWAHSASTCQLRSYVSSNIQKTKLSWKRLLNGWIAFYQRASYLFYILTSCSRT